MAGKKLGGWIVGGAFVVAIATVVVATDKNPDGLSIGLLQALTLMLSIVGSYVFGRNAAADAASDVLRPHARSAFRRVRNLYGAFKRLAESVKHRRDVLEAIAADHDGNVPIDHVRSTLDLLETQVLEQIGTADDALGDWRDIVPEEVEALEAEAQGPDWMLDGDQDA